MRFTAVSSDPLRRAIGRLDGRRGDRCGSAAVGGDVALDLRVPLLRFFLPMPTYVPIREDAQYFTDFPGDAEDLGTGSQFALVAFHHVRRSDVTPTQQRFGVVDEVLTRVGLSGERIAGASRIEEAISLIQWWTVADVITTADDPVCGEAVDGIPQNLGPSDDVVVRAIEAPRQVVRSVRLADQHRVTMPTYERLPAALLIATATGTIRGGGLHLPDDHEWQLSNILRLNHQNIEGWEPTCSTELEKITQQGSYWSASLNEGFPGAVAREQFVVARHHMEVDGEYSQAVGAAATGVEVLCYAVISALCWEEHRDHPTAPDVTGVAELLKGRHCAADVERELPKRLKGDWTSRKSPWVQWRNGGARLRNRILQTGHHPTRAEASAAIEEANYVQGFILDRIAANAFHYPRVAWMIVAEDGLQRRDAFTKRTQQAISDCRDEGWWIADYSQWHAHVIAEAFD